eukprot:3458644-Lingulodinium_polyedra.AAC.1
MRRRRAPPRGARICSPGPCRVGARGCGPPARVESAPAAGQVVVVAISAAPRARSAFCVVGPVSSTVR